MNRLILLAFVCAISYSLAAQEIWLEAGLKGGFGMSFLYNNNIANDDSYNYDITTMYGAGGKFAVNFGPYHGLALEGLYSQAGQKFDYKLSGTTGSLKNEITWKSIDTYLLYRYIRNRTYLEIGPLYSFVKAVEQTDNGTEMTDPEVYYEKNYLAGAFGFGGYLAGSNTFSVGLGIRLSYGFTDFVSEEGRAAGFPNPVKDNAYESPANTHPVLGQILLEFNFGIGYFAKTSCSKRMQFFGGGRH